MIENSVVSYKEVTIVQSPSKRSMIHLCFLISAHVSSHWWAQVFLSSSSYLGRRFSINLVITDKWQLYSRSLMGFYCYINQFLSPFFLCPVQKNYLNQPFRHICLVLLLSALKYGQSGRTKQRHLEFLCWRNGCAPYFFIDEDSFLLFNDNTEGEMENIW